MYSKIFLELIIRGESGLTQAPIALGRLVSFASDSKTTTSKKAQMKKNKINDIVFGDILIVLIAFLLLSAHPETGVFGFALSALSI